MTVIFAIKIQQTSFFSIQITYTFAWYEYEFFNSKYKFWSQLFKLNWFMIFFVFVCWFFLTHLNLLSLLPFLALLLLLYLLNSQWLSWFICKLVSKSRFPLKSKSARMYFLFFCDDNADWLIVIYWPVGSQSGLSISWLSSCWEPIRT